MFEQVLFYSQCQLEDFRIVFAISTSVLSKNWKNKFLNTPRTERQQHSSIRLCSHLNMHKLNIRGGGRHNNTSTTNNNNYINCTTNNINYTFGYQFLWIEMNWGHAKDIYLQTFLLIAHRITSNIHQTMLNPFVRQTVTK